MGEGRTTFYVSNQSQAEAAAALDCALEEWAEARRLFNAAAERYAEALAHYGRVRQAEIELADEDQELTAAA